jgi:hypothetical protein
MASPSGEPSIKRKRLSHIVEPGPTRGQPYFDNGNIVLAAEQTHYRVFKGVFDALSQVLADMFSVSQPPNRKTLLDGCPVIELDDQADDWQHVLQALFQSRYPLVSLSVI